MLEFLHRDDLLYAWSSFLMNYLLVCIVATGKGIDLVLKLFASCCVLLFLLIYSLCL